METEGREVTFLAALKETFRQCIVEDDVTASGKSGSVKVHIPHVTLCHVP